MLRIDFFRLGSTIAAAALITGCSSGDAPKAPASSGATAAQSTSNVTLTGTVIEVGMYTDGDGNYYKPNRIDARRGDIVRFVLKSGVHNVHFVADSNPPPGTTGLPKTSDYLQLPGQEFDVVVSMAPGEYYFHCDPHALLGMIGWLKVVD